MTRNLENALIIFLLCIIFIMIGRALELEERAAQIRALELTITQEANEL